MTSLSSSTVIVVAALVIAGGALAEPVVFGDSLSELEPGCVSWPDRAWPDGVLNGAIIGTTTQQWGQATFYVPWVNASTPVWILLGTNDAKLGLTGYSASLLAIIAKIRAKGVEEIHIIHTPSYHLVDEDPETLALINAAIEAQRNIDLWVCGSREYVSCGPDLMEILSVPAGDFDPDGVHFSDAGAERVAIAVPEPSEKVMLIVVLAVLFSAVLVRGRR